jgi:hypothetical protein
MWCLAAECPEHFLRVLNKALNLKKPSWFSRPVYSGLVLSMLYVQYNMYVNQQGVYADTVRLAVVWL